MSFGRHNEIFGSLRFRLTFWNTAIVLLMIIVTLWGVREGLRLTLRHEADQQLEDDTNEIVLTIEQLYPDEAEIHAELNRKAGSHTHQGLYVQIFDTDGNSVWNSINTPEPVPPFEAEHTVCEPVTEGEYRLVQVALAKPKVPHWTVRTAVSFAPLEADVARLTRLMLLAGAVVLIISPLGGYWLAGRATRPIAQIMDTTARLYPSNMEERLELRGTGDELDRLCATINGFLDRIAEYVAQNQEFTANAAHELRSPLTAIQSSIEVALNEDRTIDEYKELICDILEECSDLRILANQLLLLAECDAGRLLTKGEVVDLQQIVHRAYEMFQGVAESQGVDLTLVETGPLKMVGDGSRLRQVVNNLIDNAIKFSEAGGKIVVQLKHSITDHEAILSVRDQGSGIAAVDLPHVFERFYLGDKARLREKKGRGSGLGLPICHSIVSAHHGQIHVTSTPGAGTTVTVRLPTGLVAGIAHGEGRVSDSHAHGEPRWAAPLID